MANLLKVYYLERALVWFSKSCWFLLGIWVWFTMDWYTISKEIGTIYPVACNQDAETLPIILEFL